VNVRGKQDFCLVTENMESMFDKSSQGTGAGVYVSGNTATGKPLRQAVSACFDGLGLEGSKDGENPNR